MKLYPLTLAQVVVMLVLVALADAFTYAQGPLVPLELRPFTYLVFVVLALLLYFFLVRPRDWTALAGTLALVLGVIAIALVTVQDVIIAYRVSYRTPIVILGAVLGPYVAGWLYGRPAARR
ncbi:MAG TPA: hypothetical protein VLV30_05735 [Methanomicrobiales archaeon]|nr:hypothetical protein [Methanomicrobiales archaeon]